MSRSINRVELLGHLGKDAEVKYTPSGIQVARFSVATSRRWKPKDSSEWKEETDWHNIVLWRCENLVSFLTKGKQVYIAGRLQTRSYEDRDKVKRYTTEVIADELILLGGGDGSRAGAAPAKTLGERVTDDALGVTDDDVPF